MTTAPRWPSPRRPGVRLLADALRRSPNVLGKDVAINGHNMTIVGVAQQGFGGVELGFSPRVFIPIQMQKETFGNPDMMTDRRTRWVNAFGRLKPKARRRQKRRCSLLCIRSWSWR